ncbi:uncharacterized protein LOC113758650 isoform X1 [Coffea eugenioides]|uniref:uncharacterized protein LOC113754153 isoform X1 n=1 Tax=Coffea eugenioides TaxID=49369 RepID=UPI000F6059DB|nr:uncharacterized protein LOC113754153 isoform X1 [Coffea eugenioides]XP_027157219.1 uncharacterized protein LOC113758650 isoform X1 [Coffea eugenioides]
MSATKEAMSIFEKYVRSLSILNAEGSESLDENMSAKKRRISVSTEEELGNSLERKDAADDFGEPGHVLLGMVIFFMARLSAVTGLIEKFIFTGLRRGQRALMVNFTGLLILLFGVSVGFTVLLPRSY